ncbi:hypothetical protein OQA88_5795 [Cercophora sp. LCS_1]
MRLINTKTLQLQEFWGNDIPRYGILSHTWEDGEVTFQQLTTLSREEVSKLKGFAKIERVCKLAQRSKIEWAWVDTCCIDKSSSAELTESINSMFRWYAESAVCYAYLSDLEVDLRKKDRARGGNRKSWGGEKEKEKAKQKWNEESNWKEETKSWKEGKDSWNEGGKSWDKDAKSRNEQSRERSERRKPETDDEKSGSEQVKWEDESDVQTEVAKQWSEKGRRQELEVRTKRSDEGKSEAGSFASELDDQQVATFARCRWFTRGWTLQELIAPRRLGFYNKWWEFQGEKEKMTDELARITKINKRVLKNSDLMSTISVAQRMSWAANRQTTRAEDIAYCLLGIFGVQIPMLYGEGSKAFIRLQEEIIKESNDLSLFAWQTRARSQKHWGILALSPKDFADSSDIELWDDSMYNDEFVVTSKGLRVTPVAGGGLRAGKDSSATYVFNLQCYRQGSNKDLGIFLRKHGCDVYTRVFPDTLSEEREIGSELPDTKGRMFYVSKIVSPVLSVVLGSSHRNSIDVSQALSDLQRAGFLLKKKGGVEPAGHWDAKRHMFLTQGMRQFDSRLNFESPEQGHTPLMMDCNLREGKLSVSFTIETSPGKFASGRVLQQRDAGGRTPGRVTDWLKASVEQRAVSGQPVHYVTVEVF